MRVGGQGTTTSPGVNHPEAGVAVGLLRPSSPHRQEWMACRAGLPFLSFMVLWIRQVQTLITQARDSLAGEAVAALMAWYLLSSFFGTAIRDTVSGLVAWFGIGWTLKESVDQSEPNEQPASTS